MTSINRINLRFAYRWPLVLGTLALGLAMTLATAPSQSEDPERRAGDEQNKAWLDYSEACLGLADADLAEAESQNRRFKGSVSAYDLQRLRLHRDLLHEIVSRLRRGGDYGDLITSYAELHAKLAELDLEMAAQARRQNLASVSDEKYERLRRQAAVSRLQVGLAGDPAGALSIIDHLHWETHRLAAEVMQLNRRVERLEEIGQR